MNGELASSLEALGVDEPVPTSTVTGADDAIYDFMVLIGLVPKEHGVMRSANHYGKFVAATMRKPETAHAQDLMWVCLQRHGMTAAAKALLAALQEPGQPAQADGAEVCTHPIGTRAHAGTSPARARSSCASRHRGGAAPAS